MIFTIYVRRISSIGVLLVAGRKATSPFFIKGLFSSPKLSIFMPKAHLAITSTVNLLESLFFVKVSLKSHCSQINSSGMDILCRYLLVSNLPACSAVAVKSSTNLSAQSLIIGVILKHIETVIGLLLVAIYLWLCRPFLFCPL